jgi:metallo-beta-lactamase family protein
MFAAALAYACLVPSSLTLQFAGAADTVTGSRHIVHYGSQRVLLDCGLFQGFKALRLRNWGDFAVPPARINAVVLSHAHLDHCGYLPVLVQQGFRGAVFCTPATHDLVNVMLLDSAHLLTEEAKHANRYGYSKHAPAQPLYTVDHVKQAMKLVQTVPFHRAFDAGGLRAEFLPAGHLLGAAIVVLTAGKRRIVYSGDLGRQSDLLMPPPQRIEAADVLLVESTYGNRLHPPDDPQTQLAQIIRQTASAGGSVLMPTFAVGRAQALMLAIHRLKQTKQIPDLPVFLDSPMAQRATKLYAKHHALLRVDSNECTAICESAQFVQTPDESKQLSHLNYPCIILAGSGMATGGRILHHLKTYAPNGRNHIVFPGFQVPGTRGGRMVTGEPAVKIHGEYVAVNAKVSHIEGFSGHADAQELLDWLSAFKHPPARSFVVHGERDAADALRQRIADTLRWPVQTVEHLQKVAL